MPEKEDGGGEVIDLMEALRRSVESARGSKSGESKKSSRYRGLEAEHAEDGGAEEERRRHRRRHPPRTSPQSIPTSDAAPKRKAQ